ncbi:MAG TPA: hypothetical protein VN281_04225, partial [Verrucomicrobiae bacterium]|nr:hypothetical protein [Verrucomicrobiae bacterium]
MNLLPYPRSLRRQSGSFVLPEKAALYLESSLPRDTALLPVAERLQEAARTVGTQLELVTESLRHS